MVFLETEFYCGFDGIISFELNFESGQMLKWRIPSDPPKNLLSIDIASRYKIDPRTPQQASEMQYAMFIAEFMRKVNSANSVYDVFTFVAY